MARLHAKQRNALKGSQFAGPDRSYPIEDASHARAALSMVSRYGSPAVKSEVRRKVHEKYPGIAEHVHGKVKEHFEK